MEARWERHLVYRLGAGMVERSWLWTARGALFAIAAALVFLAIALGSSHRYQFAPSSLDGQTVWRGDTITGHAVLCATDHFERQVNTDYRSVGIVTKC